LFGGEEEPREAFDVVALGAATADVHSPYVVGALGYAKSGGAFVEIEGPNMIFWLAEQSFMGDFSETEHGVGMILHGSLAVKGEREGFIYFNLVATFEELSVLEAGVGIAFLGGGAECGDGLPFGATTGGRDQDRRGRDDFVVLGRYGHGNAGDEGREAIGD